MNTTQSVLYISYDGMTDPLGQSQVLPYLIGLTAYGYRFTLLSLEKPERLRQNGDEIRALCNADGIDWQPLSFRTQPPLIAGALNTRALKQRAFALHQEKCFGMTHCRSYLPATVGLALKRRHGVRFLFDMRGLWADEKLDAGALNKTHPVKLSAYGYLKFQEWQLLREADATVSLTERAKAEILSWRRLLHRPSIEVIPCCVDLAHFDPTKVKPEAQRALRASLGFAETDFVLSYLGSIGTWYMLDEMLDFFVELRRQRPSAKFFFITGDAPEPIIAAAAARGISGHQLRVRRAARSEVPLFLSLSSRSLFFIRPTYSKIASSPTKQGEIMAMNVPVICNANVGDTDAVVRKYQSGQLVDAFTPTAYRRVVDEIDTATLSNSLRTGAEDYFSLHKGVEKYRQLYQRLLPD
jgi:glycosyltransferase involved in cell wall biosynthesis